jgi:hypothetical protein
MNQPMLDLKYDNDINLNKLNDQIDLIKSYINEDLEKIITSDFNKSLKKFEELHFLLNIIEKFFETETKVIIQKHSNNRNYYIIRKRFTVQYTENLVIKSKQIIISGSLGRLEEINLQKKT